jgi:hypothetical protein
MRRTVIILLFLIEASFTKSISIIYHSATSNLFVRVTFTENVLDENRTFSERYDRFYSHQLPHSASDGINFDSSLISSYIDSFFYAKPLGLFRFSNSNQLTSLPSSGYLLLRATLWLDSNIFDSQSFLDYFVERYILRSHKLIESGKEIQSIKSPKDLSYFASSSDQSIQYIPAQKITIKGHFFDFNSVYNDTLWTFFYNLKEGSGGYREYKTYDSQFNLIKYTMIPKDVKMDSICYQIKLDDYKRLKKFRKDLKPIFRN